jgi:hypothetical protein
MFVRKGFNKAQNVDSTMQVLVPETGNFRGQLLLQAPFSIGLMAGMFLGITAAQSALLAVVVTVVCSLVGLGAGIVLFNWKATVSDPGYRTIWD